jgi:hypothetical protein
LIGAANMQFVVADASSWPSYNFSSKEGSTMRSSAECYAEAERLERKARTSQVARTREQCLVSAGLWREHAAQAEEREKAKLLKAAAD